MHSKLTLMFYRNDVQFVLLALQLTLYWLAVIYAPDSKEGVAYQRF
jgi:hypothetical protein